MDFQLTQYFRLISDDVVLINDVIRIYRKKRSEPLTLKEFTESLSRVIEIESQDVVIATSNSINNTFTYKTKNNNNIINGNNNSFKNTNIKLRDIFWDFFHSVLLKFSLEELSQYPFWAAKVVLTTNPRLTHTTITAMISAWFHIIKIKYQEDGIAGLYEGYIPFLAASIIQNYESFENSLRHFFVAIMTTPVNSPTTSLSNNMLYKVTRKHSYEALNNIKAKPQKSKTYIMGLIERLMSSTLSHPFLCLSVAMLYNPKLRGQNWVFSSLSILSTAGIRGLYSGLRTSLGFSLLPISSICLFGISETIIYRSMTWVGRSQDDRSGGLLSVAQTIVKNDGITGLLQYGLLTTIQIAPGFVTFIATRSLLWLFLGSSLQRKGQYSRRIQILEEFWSNRQIINNNKEKRNSSYDTDLI